MKDKNDITTNGKAVFYAVLYENFRKAAIDCGYALALHGSMASDMDLIAVAWVDDAKSHEELVKRISDCIGDTVWKDKHTSCFEYKPHNRIAYTLSIMGSYYIDLSIVPPLK